MLILNDRLNVRRVLVVVGYSKGLVRFRRSVRHEASLIISILTVCGDYSCCADGFVRVFSQVGMRGLKNGAAGFFFREACRSTGDGGFMEDGVKILRYLRRGQEMKDD